MTELTKDEFCERFVAALMTYLPKYDGPEAELRKWAWDTAPSYWEDEDQRAEGPEACAAADYDCWEPA